MRVAVKLDVAIAGGGLAGSLLARQLRRALPALRVGVFDRDAATSFKVGESLVEIASHHLIRRHGLSGYLYDHHLPKNGLRYFFDDPAGSTELPEMSEIGSVNLPFHPGFQIDRSRFEADLRDMNRNLGVRVAVGSTVQDIELGEAGAPHRLRVEDAGGTTTFEARWLVDAAGRGGLLAHRLGLRRPEPVHRIGSSWGRFEGVADVDQLGPEAWRARVQHTSRRLSTLHFWYPGYWIWFIPLRSGLTSVGVTGRVVAETPGLRTEEGLRAFLERHRAVATLLAEAKAVDHGSLARIAYGTARFVDARARWAVVGEAATAADPLYSPGSDFIALENDFASDLVARDLGGEDASEVAERAELYEAFLQFRHEATLRLYRGLYGVNASYDLARAKWDFDIGCYYNLWASSYLRDQHLDPRWLASQRRQSRFVLQALENFAGLFRRAEAHLRDAGRTHESNRGQFYYGLQNIDFAEQIGLPRSRRAVMEQTAQIFRCVRGQLLELLGEDADTGDLPLSAFVGERPLG